MIAKQVPMRTVSKSNFAQLVGYITDAQAKQDRVGYVAVTNCHQDRPDLAVLEVRATQTLNTRSSADKTYHLIVSFRAGESPSNEVLAAIEQSICDGLDFGDHQRVSAAHYDTDNVHLHIAINKVHPVTHTVHAPYNDHKTLAQLCEKLERVHGLQPDNHQAQKRGAENRASDMERHAGIESLLGWVQRECLDQIRSARTWAELHHVMADHGLELRERTNGLVITDGDEIGVKASSVARDLSKAQLEARLGRIDEHADRKVARAASPRKRYEAKPVQTKVNTTKLFIEYKAERETRKVTKKIQGVAVRERRAQATLQAKQVSATQRGIIKHMPISGAGKKLLYALVSRKMKASIQAAKEAQTIEKHHLSKANARQAWADWLKTQATAGNAQALAALRGREARTGLRGNTVAAQGESVPAALAGRQDSITKKGTVIYRVGEAAIRDDGDRLQVSRGASPDSLEAALRIAAARYGNQITVNGSDAFKDQVVHAAARASLPISFSDAALEQRRKALITTATGASNDRQTTALTAADGGRADRSADGRNGSPAGPATAGQSANPAAGNRAAGTARIATDQRPERGRADRGSDGGLRRHAAGRPGAARRKPGSSPIGRAAIASGLGRTAPGRKPNVVGVGGIPPAQRQNVLRNLHELGVVHVSDPGEVLLPRDVPHHVGQQEARDDHGVRRDVSGAGGRGVNADLTAVEKFITEREAKRVRGFGISKHIRYTAGDEGQAAFAGLRNIDGQRLALLRRDDTVTVLPVDEATGRRLGRLKVGDPVTLTATGGIKTRGRSR